MEIADADDARLLAIEFAELSEEDRSDGDVDADAEGVGPADEPEVTALSEFLDEEPVFGKEARVMHSDAVMEITRELLSKGGIKTKAPDGRFDSGFLLPRENVDAHKILSVFGRGALCEVHDVDRGAIELEVFADGLVEGRFAIGELEGDGARSARDDGDFGARARFEILGDVVDIAEGGAQQERARARKCEKGDLPGDAALAIAIVMELVHDDVVDLGIAAFAEGFIGKDFGGAGDKRRGRVDACVSRHHPHVFGAEAAAEIEEFFGDESFDWGRIKKPLPLGHGFECEGFGDKALARAGRRGEDDVLAAEQFEEGFFLRGIGFDLEAFERREKAFEERVFGGLIGQKSEKSGSTFLDLCVRG